MKCQHNRHEEIAGRARGTECQPNVNRGSLLGQSRVNRVGNEGYMATQISRLGDMPPPITRAGQKRRAHSYALRGVTALYLLPEPRPDLPSLALQILTLKWPLKATLKPPLARNRLVNPNYREGM